MDVIEYTFPRSQTGRPFYHCKVNFYYGVNMGFENCGANFKKKKKNRLIFYVINIASYQF